MSATVHTAFVDGMRAEVSVARDEALEARPVVRAVTFAALSAYGLVRWAGLLKPAPGWRLLGLLALATGLAAAGPRLRRLSRPAAVLVAVAAVIAMFPLAGIPLSWVRHVRVAVIADGIDQGLSGLPGVLVPYAGINGWIRVVVVLGAAILLLDSAVMLAFASGALTELRRAVAALPLIALAIVPATLVKPRAPYLQGLLLFALLVAFVWGERLRRPATAGALGAAALAAVAALVIGPALDPHAAWFDYRSWAGAIESGKVDSFNWTQTYGPLRWPHRGHTVLEVRARTGDYWKAENLATFNGTAWTGAAPPGEPPLPAPSRANVTRWSQDLQVTIRGMKTRELIGAGVSTTPAHVPGHALPGATLGTWISGEEMSSGATYRVRTYSPRPTAEELASAPRRYPVSELRPYLTLGLPDQALPSAVVFPLFHSGRAIRSADLGGGSIADTAVRSSPYARAYALARRLAAHSATPYQFILSVQSYLAHGFTYDQNPPLSRYPLESFLFATHAGYCQQFSGAMALLLRMGGVPARVAAGFTSGAYDRGTGQWLVSDKDAHAWVEAWFPTYGWVRFDPTPVVAPARGGAGAAIGSLPKSRIAAGQSGVKPAGRPAAATPKPGAAGRSAAGHGGLPVALLALAVIALAAIGALAYLELRTIPEPTDAELLDELERALRRTGRPVGGGVTLTGLERRFRSAPDAAAYVRRVRMSRYAGEAGLPSPAERRALRSQLALGLGTFGRLRALWALPPRLGRRQGG